MLNRPKTPILSELVSLNAFCLTCLQILVFYTTTPSLNHVFPIANCIGLIMTDLVAKN